MTGQKDREAVAAVGAGDGAHRRGTTDGVGELGIGADRAIRNAAKRLPHGLIECRARRTDRNAELNKASTEVARQFAPECPKMSVVARNRGIAVVMAQIFKFPWQCGAIAELEEDDTRRLCHCKHRAQGRGQATVVEHFALTGLSGRHAERLLERVAEPADRFEARLHCDVIDPRA